MAKDRRVRAAGVAVRYLDRLPRGGWRTISLPSGRMAAPMTSEAGPPSMKPPGTRQLSVLLVGALLLCHGVFGVLHLLCYSPQCVGDAEHAAEHQTGIFEAVGGAQEHPAGHDPADHGAGHGTGAGYFAVLVFGLLGLLLGLLPEGTLERVGTRARWHRFRRRATIVSRPARPPTSPVLQVFRL